MYTLQPRAHYRTTFDGSDSLFRAAWKQYRRYLADSIDNPTCDADVLDWLDSIASELVNDSDSPFYIYG